MTDKQKDEFFKLLDTCTREIVPAVKVITPPDFPESSVKAVRFLMEKEMERYGTFMDIFFVTRDTAGGR